jgi:hypothetical protein
MAKQGGGGPQETEADRAVAEVARARVADFRTRWAPQTRRLASDIDAMGAADSVERRGLRGSVTTDTDVAFTQAGEKQLSAASATGNFGGAGQKLGIGELGDAQATSVGLGTNQAELNVDAAHKVGLAGVVARGQGREAMADSGLLTQAQMQRQVANADAAAALEDDMGVAGLVGQAAGIALGQGLNTTGTRDYNREALENIQFANRRERPGL